MFYRIQADLMLTTESNAHQLTGYLRDLLTRLEPDLVILSNQERSSITFHRCRHDEPDPPPCDEPIIRYFPNIP